MTKTKKNTWFMAALMVLLAPALAGCKYKCRDAKGVKNDILRIQEIYEGALSDRERWNYACGELLALSARLGVHRTKLDRLATSRSCERNESCTAVATLSSQLGELQTSTQSICHSVQDGVARLENFVDSTAGRELTLRARRAVTLIQNGIIPPGTVMLTQVCGDDELFANLSPVGNGSYSSTNSSRSGRSDEDLVREAAAAREAAALDEEEAGSAGSAE